MTDNDDIEIVRGSGNVFRDFGYPDADVRQAKALLAGAVFKRLDAQASSTPTAEAKPGIAHSELSASATSISPLSRCKSGRAKLVQNLLLGYGGFEQAAVL